MSIATGRSTLLAASAVLLGLTVIVPRAFGVEEMRQFNKDDTKTSKTKNCPRGTAYSEKKRDCVKSSGVTGKVWSSGAESCLDGNSAALTDKDLYLAAGDF